MVEYISREAAVRYLKGYSEKECNSNSPYGMIISSVLNKVERALSEMPAADIQPVDEITKIIQARLNGVQKVKIDAMLSGDSNTAYKMVGAETICIAILQDLEAIKE